MIFFTSDHHFYHANIIKYCKRPFQSVEEMNEEMVYYLGDFSLAKRPVELFAPRLNGDKHFIMGNHDACHPCNKKKAEAALHVYLDVGFKMIGLESLIEIGGQKVRLHHMPYGVVGDQSYEQKHQNFRPRDDGMWLLHGHVHEKWKVKDRMINVGVDVWDFYPVPIGEIENLINAD
jgi:calcineurin-like phosphoesterase family protein